MLRLLRQHTLRAATGSFSRATLLSCVAASPSPDSRSPLVRTSGSSRRFARWSPDPLSNPWGRAAGEVVRKQQNPPKQQAGRGGQVSKQGGKAAKRGGKALKPGTPSWRKHMSAMQQGVTIAVEGCCHGDLDKIYATLQAMEVKEGRSIDLLICCGDFQAVRNKDDLECLACPPKYRDMKSFWRYYTGAARAPFPTIFVGGNHEAANHLWELHYGGWVAPNIYYLGAAGVVNFGGVRIAGLSGIYNARHYKQGHHEMPPYTDGSMRSAYHVRELDVYRLAQLKQPVDIGLSHDWPRGIAHHGDTQSLLRAKTWLRDEVNDNSLGSPPAEMLLKDLRPDYWFSAHMHVKFAAVVNHAAAASGSTNGRSSGGGVGGRSSATKFLALDKCLPRRGFLQVVDFPEARGPKELQYDEEWLAVLRGTHHLMSLSLRAKPLPGMGGARHGPSAADLDFVRQRLAECGAAIPHNFVPTAPGWDPGNPAMQRGHMPRSSPRNPQTVALLDLLGLPYNLDPSAPPQLQPLGGDSAPAAAPAANPEEIDLDAEDEETAAAANPEEIDIDDVVSDGENPAAAATLAADEVPQGDPGPGASVSAAAAAEHRESATAEAGSESVATTSATPGGSAAGVHPVAQPPGGVMFNSQQGGAAPQQRQRGRLSAALPPPRSTVSADPAEIDLPE